MMEQLIHWIEGICPVSPELRAALEATVSIISVKKDDILLKPGQDCTYAYFVLEGLVKGYTKNGQGEHIRWFRKENEPALPMPGFFNQTRSDEYIAALEDCQLACITKQDHDELILRFQELLFIDHLLLERQLEENKAHANMLKLPVRERYYYFQEHYHDLLGRISQKQIAYFLHTTHETISRLRSGKYKKGRIL